MGLVHTKSYEDLLGDGIEFLLARKATTLAELVAGLNELNVRGPAGQTWTEDLLAQEFQRLGG